MKHPMVVTIVGGGKLSKRFLAEIIKSEYVIGVDRGAHWLITNGIIPDIAIGDFDSVNTNEFRIIKQKVKHVEAYPKEKDFTDMELGVNYALSLHPKEVHIYGASGGRLDHTFAAVQLLTKFLVDHIQAIIRDEQNEILLVSKKQTIRRVKMYQYLSVLPLGKVVTVTMKGFKYDVLYRTIIQGSTLGVSNEIIGESGVIEVHNGIAVVIYSRDR